MITKEQVIEKLKSVYDPEIPISIYDLGLIYRIDVQENNIEVDMTLTAPGCPMASYVAKMAEEALNSLEGVNNVKVNIVWEPRWTPDMISEEAKQKLNIK